MNCDNKPVEAGNAAHIIEVCNGERLLMLKYNAIADYFSEEPFIIKIYFSDKGSPYTFEQVLRIRQWIPNQETISWCIYSEDRNLEEKGSSSVGGIIIRKVKWDSLTDQKNKMLNPKIERSEWPTLFLHNFYIDQKKTLNIINELKNIDTLIEKGILLSDRSNFGHDHNWNEREFRRLFDWGSIHVVWHPIKTNQELEVLMDRLTQMLDKTIYEQNDRVYQMELDYTIPTIIRRKLVDQGEIK